MHALEIVPHFSYDFLEDQNNTNTTIYIYHSHLNWPVIIDLIAAVPLVKDHGVACHFRGWTDYWHFLQCHPEKDGSVKILNNEKTAMF